EWFDACGMRTPTIFTAVDPDVHTVVRAMKAGAFGFVAKPFRGPELVDVLFDAIERSKAGLAAEFELRRRHEDYESLSPREREVMGLVVRGKLNKVVGAELGITEVTVKVHRGRVMQKMRAGSLADLVKIAAELRVAQAPAESRLS